jgi:hypothetical protein
MKFVGHEAGTVRGVAVSANMRLCFDAWRARLLLEKARRDLF